MKIHKWWHFIYGKELNSEIVLKTNTTETRIFWEECKKCKCRVGEKWGSTTFRITIK